MLKNRFSFTGLSHVVLTKVFRRKSSTEVIGPLYIPAGLSGRRRSLILKITLRCKLMKHKTELRGWEVGIRRLSRDERKRIALRRKTGRAA